MELYSSMSHARRCGVAASVSNAPASRLDCGGYTAQRDIVFRMPLTGTPLLLPVLTRMAVTRTIWYMIPRFLDRYGTTGLI